ncbi:MAG: ribonuclease P protein component [Candidatus Harrisonbacteria bacterium]|nr:ribonuclease P protein component [Candidatus Harrisonbacteria bacterium]
MLAKKYRLPIQSVIGKNARVVKTPFFLFKIFPSRFSYSRFGIIISKKVAQKSTARNKIKRMIFSALNPNQQPINDFLIIASPKIKNLTKEEIIKHVSNYFQYPAF